VIERVARRVHEVDLGTKVERIFAELTREHLTCSANRSSRGAIARSPHD